MIAVGHTSVGVILGVVAIKYISDSTLPLPLEVVGVGLIGVASHYLMDLVPHGHYEINQAKPTPATISKLALDLVFPILLLASFLLLTNGFGRESWLVGAGVLGSQLPDIINGLRSQKLLPQARWLEHEARFHSSTHWHNPTNPAKATGEGGRKLSLFDIWQAAIGVVALLLLLTI